MNIENGVNLEKFVVNWGKVVPNSREVIMNTGMGKKQVNMGKMANMGKNGKYGETWQIWGKKW